MRKAPTTRNPITALLVGFAVLACILVTTCVTPTRPMPPEECEEGGPIKIDARQYNEYIRHIEEGDTISFCEWLEGPEEDEKDDR